MNEVLIYYFKNSDSPDINDLHLAAIMPVIAANNPRLTFFETLSRESNGSGIDGFFKEWNIKKLPCICIITQNSSYEQFTRIYGAPSSEQLLEILYLAFNQNEYSIELKQYDNIEGELTGTSQDNTDFTVIKNSPIIPYWMLLGIASAGFAHFSNKTKQQSISILLTGLATYTGIIAGVKLTE